MPGPSSRSGTPRVIEVKLKDLHPNPNQPRKVFDPAGLRELARSIERHGLLNPITVADNPAGAGYIIVAGERRYRAHELLKRNTIPAIRTGSSPDEIALIENIQREDLSPLEEAEALARLKEQHGYTQAQLADIVGKARATITNILGLNRLHEQIKQECSTSNIASKSLLIELSKIKDRDEQLKLWKKTKRGLATVKSTRAKRNSKVPAESKVNLEMRAMLIEDLVALIEQENYTQQEAARRLGTSQPRLSDVLNRRADKFTIDALINMFAAADIPVRIVVGKKVS